MTTERIGGREIDVETSPMKAASANFRTISLHAPRDGCLVLRPSLGVRVLASVFLVIGFAILAVASYLLLTGVVMEGKWFLLAFGVVFAVVGAIFFVVWRRHEF